MGVSFVRTSAHWSYSGFHDFRERLAKEIGVDLNEMDGYAKYQGKSWKGINDDIAPLLFHSDMDGSIKPEDCKRVAPRLHELIASWDDADDDKHQAMLLMMGMELCAEINKPLEFI